MNEFTYEIRRTSRRKSVALRVDGERVIVLAPQRCPEKFIRQLIHDKTAWLNKQFAKITEQRQQLANMVFEQDGEFWYYGKPYRLNLITAHSRQLVLDNDVMHLHLPDTAPDKVQHYLFTWYRQQAKNVLPAKTAEVAALITKPYRSVKFGKFKGQWGSCNRAGDIRYNWLLMQAPEAVMDYVVTHEVCHLAHMNHSPDFWELVGSICPDYKNLRKWLRQNGHLLYFAV